MLPLHDGQLRLLLLTHLVTRLERGEKAELVNAGMEPEQLDRLRALSLSEIHRLAALREPFIGLALDGPAFKAGLRNLAFLSQTQFLEDYFIRHGASPALMTALFKMPYKTTLARRRAASLGRGRGRPALIPIDARDRIQRIWMDLAHLDMRQRYYRLHQAFPLMSLHALHRVVTEFDELR
jgi:hypothetical protein